MLSFPISLVQSHALFPHFLKVPIIAFDISQPTTDQDLLSHLLPMGLPGWLR